MKWIDYREELGLSFNELQKFVYLKNRILNYIEILRRRSIDMNEECYRLYAITVGEYDVHFTGESLFHIRKSFLATEDMKDLLAKYIAFYNAYTQKRSPYYQDYSYELLSFIKESLDSANISFELRTDEDGVFIFPY